MARRYPSRQTRRYAERHQYGGGGGNTTPHRFDWTIVAKIASAGGTTLVVALAFGSFSPAGLLDMATAYGMLIAAQVIGVLVIVFSEMVWNFPIKHRIIAGIIASLILGGLLFALGRYEHFKNFELTHITPADLPTPPTTCEINDDELAVFLGNVVVVANKFPHTVLAMGEDKDGNPYPIIQINKYHGDILLQILRIFSDSGDIITRVDEDDTWSNEHFRVKKPDPHTIIAYDNHDVEVLKLQFLNKKVLRITGILRRTGVAPVEINQSEVLIGNKHFLNLCIKDFTKVVYLKMGHDYRIYCARHYKSSSRNPSISNTAKQARKKLAANVPRASLPVIEVSVSSMPSLFSR